MTRRSFLNASSASLATGSLILPLMSQESTSRDSTLQMGVAATSYLTAWRPKDAYEFLEHCHSLGAAGIQAPMNGDLKKIRARAEQLGMYIEAMVPLPKGRDSFDFEQSLRDAAAVGAVALRSACLSTRRYETFSSFTEWHAFLSRSNDSLETALRLLDRYKIPLGIENHKDWTAEELALLLEKHSSEYLGVCLDFGNNISLLDDPMMVVEKLAPYAVSTHLKNMGVAPDSDGFLLSEVLLGDGFLDLPRMISLVRQSRPKTRFCLEMITRDPLRVPCLADKYWATFPDRNGLYLARTLKLVQKEQSSKPLPRISQLSREDQLRTEEQNVVSCLGYAHERLGL